MSQAEAMQRVCFRRGGFMRTAMQIKMKQDQLPPLLQLPPLPRATHACPRHNAFYERTLLVPRNPPHRA